MFDSTKVSLWHRVRPTIEALAAQVTPGHRDCAPLLLQRFLDGFDNAPWARVPDDPRAPHFTLCPVHCVEWELQPFPLAGPGHEVWVVAIRDELTATHPPWQQQVPPAPDAPEAVRAAYALTKVAGANDDHNGILLSGKQLDGSALRATSASPAAILVADIGFSLGHTRDTQPYAGPDVRTVTLARSMLRHRELGASLFKDTRDRGKMEGPLSYVPKAITRQKIVTKINECGLKHRLSCSFQAVERGGSGQNTAATMPVRFHSIPDLVAGTAELARLNGITPSRGWVCAITYAKCDVKDCFNVFPTPWRQGDIQSFADPTDTDNVAIYRQRYVSFGVTNGCCSAMIYGDTVVDRRARGFGATSLPPSPVPPRFGPDPPATLFYKVDDFVSVHQSIELAHEGLLHTKGLIKNDGASTKDVKDRVTGVVDFDGFDVDPTHDVLRLGELKIGFYTECIRDLLASIRDSGTVVEGPLISLASRLNWSALAFPGGRAHIMPFFIVIWPEARHARMIDPEDTLFSATSDDPFHNPRLARNLRTAGRFKVIAKSPGCGRIWNKRATHPIGQAHPLIAALHWWEDAFRANRGTRLFLYWRSPGIFGPRQFTRAKHAIIDSSHTSDVHGRSVTRHGYPVVTWDAAPGRVDHDGNVVPPMGFGWCGNESFRIVFPRHMTAIFLLEYVTGFYCRHVHPFEFHPPYDPDLIDDRRLGLRGDNTPGLHARRRGYAHNSDVNAFIIEDWRLEAADPQHIVSGEIEISTHWNTTADRGSRGRLQPHTDDWHFCQSVYDTVVAPLAPNGYTVESHASVSGDNCRSPRWGHRFSPFATLELHTDDDVLINAPFTSLVRELKVLVRRHHEAPFAFTFVLPIGRRKTRPFVPFIVRQLERLGAYRAHTFLQNDVVFRGRKTTYYYPDRSTGFTDPMPLPWTVQLWRRD